MTVLISKDSRLVFIYSNYYYMNEGFLARIKNNGLSSDRIREYTPPLFSLVGNENMSVSVCVRVLLF